MPKLVLFSIALLMGCAAPTAQPILRLEGELLLLRVEDGWLPLLEVSPREPALGQGGCRASVPLDGGGALVPGPLSLVLEREGSAALELVPAELPEAPLLVLELELAQFGEDEAPTPPARARLDAWAPLELTLGHDTLVVVEREETLLLEPLSAAGCGTHRVYLGQDELYLESSFGPCVSAASGASKRRVLRWRREEKGLRQLSASELVESWENENPDTFQRQERRVFDKDGGRFLGEHRRSESLAEPWHAIAGEGCKAYVVEEQTSWRFEPREGEPVTLLDCGTLKVDSDCTLEALERARKSATRDDALYIHAAILEQAPERLEVWRGFARCARETGRPWLLPQAAEALRVHAEATGDNALLDEAKALETLE